MQITRSIVVGAVLVTGALGVGCGAASLPADRVAAPRESIRAAEELGADKVPRASLHLKLARDQIATADAFLKDGDEARASWILLRAEADAELAVAYAKEDKTKAEAREAQAKIRELQDRTQSNQP